MKTLIEKVARHPVLPNLMMIVILLAGFHGFNSLRRESFPPISVDRITITVPYPGASSTEIEEGVIIKIERSLKGIHGIKNIESKALEGIAVITLELHHQSRPSEEILQNVKENIDKINSFPKEAEKPEIKEIIATDTAMLVILYGDAKERVLRELAYDIHDELFALGISQIRLLGTRDYEIIVEVSDKKLQAYGLTMEKVASIIRQGSLNLPSGSIRTKDREYKIEIKGRRYTAKEYKNLIIITQQDGTAVRLHQIAKVKDTFKIDSTIGQFNKKRSVLFTVSKTEKEDTIKISRKVSEYIKKRQQDLPHGMHLDIFADFSQSITDRIQLLLKNGWQGLLLLFFTLWLFMNLRLAFWIAIGIPIAFAFTGIVLATIGSSLNMINLFGLILVLGIVVDDAIVIGENIHRHQRQSGSMMQGALDGTAEMSSPVIAAVTTTIFAFMPLFFIYGIMGKFIAILPLVVVTTLIGSLIESMYILPAHLGHLKEHKPKDNFATKIRAFIDNAIDFVIDKIYSPIYYFSLKYRYTTVALAMVSFMLCISLMLGGYITFILAPERDALFLKAQVVFPQGTPISYTQKAILKMENAALSLQKKYQKPQDIPYVQGVFSIAGSNKENQGDVYVTLVGPEKRLLHSKDIVNLWRKETGNIPYALEVSFLSLGGGGFPKDIEFFIESSSLQELQNFSLKLQKKLSEYPGVYDIESDFKPGKPELHIQLKPYGRIVGLTLQSVATQIRQGFYGLEALKIQRGRDEVNIQIKYPKLQSQHLQHLYNIRLRTQEGHEIPFSEVAEIKQKRGVAEIIRRNGKRRVRLTADVDENKITADQVLEDLQKSFVAFKKEFPRSQIRLEGSDSESTKAMESLGIGFGFALLGIYTVLTLIFRSYIQPMLIMVTIPLGLVGAVVGHMVLGYPLTMFSLFGVVALSGIVVNDSLVLIEQINSSQRKGESVIRALKKAGPLRFRAIILTSMTTTAGVFPILTEQSFQAQMLKPMALALASGLVFATVLTLFVVPCFYLILNDIRRVCYWLSTGFWPTQEEVEPAHKQKQEEIANDASLDDV